MKRATMGGRMPAFPEEIGKRRRIIFGELKQRNLWFVKLRWWVPPSIAAGSIAAWLVGVDFAFSRTLAAAVFILAYNVVFFMSGRDMEQWKDDRADDIRRFTLWQVSLDYAAMFLLIHFTGGAASPLIFFFIFHIIFASILLPPASAYGFAALAAGGMAVIALAEYPGFIPHHALYFNNQAIDLAHRPFHMTVELAFFAASVFITAYSTTSIVTMLRKRIIDLAELSEITHGLNSRFNSLPAMIQAIGSIRNLDQVLDLVTSELARVMAVKAISIKLLSPDNKYLMYAAGYGLPGEFLKDKLVEVERSPLNRKIIEGEPFATGHVTEREMFQFGEYLAAARIQSVLFVPLVVEERVTGILGAYCMEPDRFNEEEVDFFRLAAGLVAIALDNARSYESIESLIKERSWFMMRVAHNLRAPLTAILGMIEVLREAHFGALNPEQAEYVRRVDRRARTMLTMINELMTLATSKTKKEAKEKKELDVSWLAGRLERTFKDEALERKLDFKVTVRPGVAFIWGNSDSIEQLLENLVSNAVKYTPAGGRVDVIFSRASEDMTSIEVYDTGIGIPRELKPKLFSEFFRAPNAKQVEEIGTGLGLAIVKEIVELHGGRITVESEEGCGSIFMVSLPCRRPEVK